MDTTSFDSKYYSKHPNLGPEVFERVEASLIDEGIERNKGSGGSQWLPPTLKRLDRPGQRAIGSRPARFNETGVLINTTACQRARGFRIRLDIDGCQITIIKPPESGEGSHHEPQNTP